MGSIPLYYTEDVLQKLQRLEKRCLLLTDEDKKWIEQKLAATSEHISEHIIEAMREMQTEILRGFHAHSEGSTIRLRKIEADQSSH